MKSKVKDLNGRRVKIQKTGTVFDGSTGTVSFYNTSKHKYNVIIDSSSPGDSRWQGSFKLNQLELFTREP